MVVSVDQSFTPCQIQIAVQFLDPLSTNSEDERTLVEPMEIPSVSIQRSKRTVNDKYQKLL